jgi:hypothetical protein
MHQAVVALTPEGKTARVGSIALHPHTSSAEKDSGIKLMALYTAYTTALPPVHAKVLAKTTLGRYRTPVGRFKYTLRVRGQLRRFAAPAAHKALEAPGILRLGSIIFILFVPRARGMEKTLERSPPKRSHAR